MSENFYTNAVRGYKPLNLGLGEHVTGRTAHVHQHWVIYGLGSCIGLILSDPVARVSGMAHILLPQSPVDDDGRRPGKYADTAIEVLIDDMLNEGACRERIVAQIAGGAKILQLAALGDIGQRNLKSVRILLADRGIPIVAHSVGGTTGRTLRWNPNTGIAVVDQIGTPNTVLTPYEFRFR